MTSNVTGHILPWVIGSLLVLLVTSDVYINLQTLMTFVVLLVTSDLYINLANTDDLCDVTGD